MLYRRSNLRPVMHNEAVCQVGTLLTLLDGALAPAAVGSEILAPIHYTRLFLYCLTWSVGGLLPQSDRGAFDEHLRTLAEDMPSKASDFPIADGCKRPIIVPVVCINYMGYVRSDKFRRRRSFRMVRLRAGFMLQNTCIAKARNMTQFDCLGFVCSWMIMIPYMSS